MNDQPGDGPLRGLRIAVTRDPSQASALCQLIAERGAEPVELPLIEIQAPADAGPLDRALSQLDAYDWIVFTSANAVRAVRAHLPEGGEDRLRNRQICVIGTATRDAVEREGWRVSMMPERAVAEGVVAAFEALPLEGRRILFPAAAAARDVVPVELGRMGANVDVVEAYRTAPSERGAQQAGDLFRNGPKPDWVTLASPSAVKALLSAVPREALAGVRLVSIGPVTSAAMKRHDLAVDAEAAEQSAEGMLQAIEKAMAQGGN